MALNYNSRVIRMMLLVVASLMAVILMTLEVSFLLLENIYSTGVTNDDRHITFVTYYTGHCTEGTTTFGK